MFFVFRIKSATAAGKRASQAVHDLDDQRGSMSVPQFHSSFQQKRKRPHASANSGASMSDRAPFHIDEFVFTLSFFSFFFLFSSAPRSLYTDTITARLLILCGISRRYLLRPV
jgi:hypothetical protein